MKRLLALLLISILPAYATCPAGYGYYRTITIDHTKIPNTDQTNFPLLISSTVTEWKTTGNGGHVQNTAVCGADSVTAPTDFLFADDINGSTLDVWDVETYTTSSGLLNAHVKIPSVSHTTDNVSYAFYGKSSVTTCQGNPTSTWSGYSGVWHLPNGSTLNLGNSAGASTPTNHSATATTGQIDGAIATTTSNYADTGYTPSSITNFTLEAWVNETSHVAVEMAFSNRDSATNNGIFMLYENTVGAEVGFNNAGALTRRQVNVNISTGAWHHIVGTHAAGAANVVLYVDGTSLGFLSNSAASNPGNAGGPFIIGRDGASTSPFGFTGALDEARFSTSVLTADWVKAEYNNQNSPSTFYTIGSEIACPASTAVRHRVISQ